MPPTSDAFRGYPGQGYLPPPGGQQQGPRPPYGPQQQPQQPVVAGTPPHSHNQAPALPTAGPQVSAPSTGSQPHPPAPTSINSNAPSNQSPAQGMPPASVPQNYPPTGPPSQDYYRPDQVCLTFNFRPNNLRSKKK